MISHKAGRKVKAIQYSDDSDGDIGGCADEAMEVLYQVSKSELPEEQRKFLLEYAVAAFKKGILKLMERASGRNHYQEATRYIRRMKKIGEVEKSR